MTNETVVTHTNQDVVLFSKGLKTFALSIDLVVEIIRPIEAKILPLSPKAVKGVINIRDAVYPLVCLDRFFNLSQADASLEDERFILVKSGDSRFALDADYIVSLTSFKSTQPLPDNEPDSLALKPYIEGQITCNEDETAYLLDLKSLVHTIKEEANQIVTS